MAGVCRLDKARKYLSCSQTFGPGEADEGQNQQPSGGAPRSELHTWILLFQI